MPLVEARGLARSFGSVRAVQDLTFDVASGELFGVVGPDGAGKTTLLRMLAGILPPTDGDARIGGVSLGEDPEATKALCAYMPQRFGLYEDLTVLENLEFYADIYEVPAADRAPRMERLFAFSRLESFADRLAGALSGGMKQKLALSCALIHAPRLLLLDEPTFGVDPISRRELWMILHEMVANGVTLIVTTSYLDEAERCDRTLLLHEGQALALDTPDKLLESASGTLLRVRTAHPRADRDRFRGIVGVRSAVLFGDRLHVTIRSDSHGAAWDEVAAEAAALGVDILGVEPGLPTLEDVFLERVGSAA